MQSQEGTPHRQTFDEGQGFNPDPREQRQASQAPQEYEERPYEERAYTEGYAGLDAEDSWARPGEKIYPRSTGQRGIGGPLLLLIVLCALVLAGLIFGIVASWLSWLLLAVVLIAGLTIIGTNWRVVTMPLPLQTFQVQDHPQLIIQDSAGSISIRRGEDNFVAVAATRRMSGIGMTPENMQVACTLQDNRLNISAHAAWNMFQFGIRYLDLVITVPESCDIQVRNGSGKVVAQGVNGRVDVGTGSGGIDISEMSGQITLKTGSGSVSGTQIDGQLKLLTGNGGITLERVALTGSSNIKTGSGPISGTEISGELTLLTGSGGVDLEQAALKGSSRIKTGSGSITLTGELDSRGNYDIVTGSGSVSLMLPSYSSFRLNASTGLGGVLNDFDDGRSGQQGGAPLRIRSGSGTIRVQRSDSGYPSY